MSSESDVPGTEAEAAAAHESLAYGMVSLKGRRPTLTDAVAAAPSFTVLSPPMGLDFFAVIDGHLGAAAAEHLRARLGAAIAERIVAELRTETPLFEQSCDVPGWWTVVIQDAFRAVHEEEVVSDESGAAGEEAGDAAAVVGATALVVLVLEKYIVVANNSGTSKVMLCRGGDHVDITPAGHTAVVAGRSSSSSSDKGRIVPPEVTVVERTALDEFLILGSDGLWDAGVTAASACGAVRARLLNPRRITMPWETRPDGSGSPTLLAKELAERAVRHHGGRDSVSVVLVIFRDFWSTAAYGQ